MHALKLIQIGDSLGVVLPKEAASRLKAESGGVVYLTEEPKNGYRLCSRDSAATGQVAAAGCVMAKRRKVLRTLAK